MEIVKENPAGAQLAAAAAFPAATGAVPVVAAVAAPAAVIPAAVPLAAAVAAPVAVAPAAVAVAAPSPDILAAVPAAADMAAPAAVIPAAAPGALAVAAVAAVPVALVIMGGKKKKGKLPLIGCPCGAATKHCAPTTGVCNTCNMFQCLHCGEDFSNLRSCTNHQSALPSHGLRTAKVTTEHPSCPPERKSDSPPLSAEIVVFQCKLSCGGQSAEGYKLNQYTSKCRKCDKYKCLLCNNFFYGRSELNRHVINGHKMDAMQPVTQEAIDMNKKLATTICAKRGSSHCFSRGQLKQAVKCDVCQHKIAF